MNKCLVTKLKSTTNNTSLQKFGVLKIEVSKGDSGVGYQRFVLVPNTQTKIEGDISFYKSGLSGDIYDNPISIAKNYWFEASFENKNGIIEISPKYNIKDIRIGSNAKFNVSDLNFSDCEGIDGVNIYGDITNVFKKNKSIIKRINCKNVYGNVSKDDILEAVNLEEIIEGWNNFTKGINTSWIVNAKKIKTIYDLDGDLSDLYDKTSLGLIGFKSFNTWVGDIGELVNHWIELGRTSGRITTEWISTQRNRLTYNGVILSSAFPDLPSSVNTKMNWTSDGTVTFTAS